MLFRALCRGSDERARLPPELVLSIFRGAEITSREGSAFDATAKQSIRVSASSGTVKHKDWFATAPLAASTLHHLAAVRLYTTSHDQGWASRPELGSYTWFEICIASPSARAGLVVAKRADGTELRWRSHHNPVANSTPQELRGEVFGPHHELWEYLRESNIIVVRACAQYGGWSNFAMKGALRFTKFFEPIVT
ncbi:hypothetical protein AURDEDRAFT_119009 [Auricularia subglabra TFB-10046 SS5]|nr:hypothetical protein AURDEDRAFT_119009 [Auricularia subglabra TFB-10046 SS5]